MDGNHFVVNCTLTVGTRSIPTFALIDCGATGLAFIDIDFMRQHSLPTTLLSTPRTLEVIDGRPISSGAITHRCQLGIQIGTHLEGLPMFVTTLGHYPLVLGIPWLRRHDVALHFATNRLSFGSEYCLHHCLPGNRPSSVSALLRPPPEDPDLALLSVAKTRIPPEYADFASLFSEEESWSLPPHRPYDHSIPLRDGASPAFGPLYTQSHRELQVLREWLDDNLEKGFIRASSSPAASPILFVKKPDGELRLCVDFRDLNQKTIKNRYPLPLFRETLMRLHKAKVFTKLDVRSAYNLIRMAPGEEWKTAFRTRYGLYESLVMPFGLTNAPASFQHFINDTLHEYLDVFCTAYLDDILIYSENPKEHTDHVRLVLTALSGAGLNLKPEKCEFRRSTVKYLGMIISDSGCGVDPAKVATIQEWATPRNVKDIQSFLGFANFLRRFVQGYSGIAAPITRLTRKDTPFKWGREQQDAFDELKQAFTTAPVLRHFDPDLPTTIETDASDYVSAGIMSQPDREGRLHPVAYFSKKHSLAECNYEIHDKELLAIIRCFEEWRPELEGSPCPVRVLTDHRNLEYFITKKLLNRRKHDGANSCPALNTRWSIDRESSEENLTR